MTTVPPRRSLTPPEPIAAIRCDDLGVVHSEERIALAWLGDVVRAAALFEYVIRVVGGERAMAIGALETHLRAFCGVRGISLRNGEIRSMFEIARSSKIGIMISATGSVSADVAGPWELPELEAIARKCGWPVCALCRRGVDEVQTSRDVMMNKVFYDVRCHRAVERATIAIDTYARAVDFPPTVAPHFRRLSPLGPTDLGVFVCFKKGPANG